MLMVLLNESQPPVTYSQPRMVLSMSSSPRDKDLREKIRRRQSEKKPDCMI